MAVLDNDLLDLWIKARDGLPVDEARLLIEQMQNLRDHVASLEMTTAHGDDE